MKTTKSNNKTNLLVMFICTMIVLAAITLSNYSSRKEIKKQVQEQERNDYSDALIKSCEQFSAVSSGKYNPKGNSLLVNRPEDWVKHSKRLVENPNLITDLSLKLYDDVKDKYNLDTVTDLRRDVYLEVIGGYNEK